MAIEGETPTIISTNTYSYSTGSWGDLLTSYNGTAITYDEIGNPISYYNGSSYSFTWSGRQLVGAVKGNDTFTFTYNEEGIRTSKTKNGVTTTYYLIGSQIMAEETNGNVTVYLYDNSGSPIGMQYHAATSDEYEWEIYWYEKNLAGDIVAIHTDTDVRLASYHYDAWGNTFATYYYGAENSKVADNPFTYRGYYYDKDLNLYYLGTRYYDSATKRFVNADAALYHSMLGYNMYTYCNNNPVNYYDHEGEFAVAITVGATAIGFLASVILAEIVYQVSVDVVEFIDETVDAIRDNKHTQSTVGDLPKSIHDRSNNIQAEDKIDDNVLSIEKYEPNPYARPGEKKQNRENRNKSRYKDDWQPRNNRRDGKPAKPKSHTPSKKGHKKYFEINDKIDVF